MAVRVQVFDLGKHEPEHVLGTIYRNFSDHESADPDKVAQARARLRVIAAGGDGTVAWVLQVRSQCITSSPRK